MDWAQSQFFRPCSCLQPTQCCIFGHLLCLPKRDDFSNLDWDVWRPSLIPPCLLLMPVNPPNSISSFVRDGIHKPSLKIQDTRSVYPSCTQDQTCHSLDWQSSLVPEWLVSGSWIDYWLLLTVKTTPSWFNPGMLMTHVHLNIWLSGKEDSLRASLFTFHSWWNKCCAVFWSQRVQHILTPAALAVWFYRRSQKQQSPE